jgi:eukaryotic-like serine/threonine-protein kinase
LASIGQRFGPYRCVRKLGSGGMAETWLAVQHGEAGFEQRVCLKLIHEPLRNSDDFGNLFMREAAIAASLRHSNIVGVIDASPGEGCMALELVEGTDLRTLLAHAASHQLAPDLCAFVAVELCKALHYAHTRTRAGEFAGVVHRDISPANVLVSYAGEVKLADFGIAKAIRATGDVSSGLRGKLVYMSPEQLTGRPLDARSDLFSLGILLFEAASGRRPFDGSSDAETCQRILEGRLEALARVAPHVPAGLADIVQTLLQHDPELRFESAAATIAALVECAPGATAYRELGRLAKQARPHETLSAEVGLPGDTPDRAGVAQLATRTLPRPRADARVATTPRTAWKVDGRGTRRWVAVGTALAGMATGALVAARSFGTDNADRASLRIEPAPAPQPATGDAPRRPIVEAAAPAASVATPAPETAPAVLPNPNGAVTVPRSVRKRREQPTGQLEVGAFPGGMVWVDGELRGRAPLLLRLPAGPHAVAVGEGSPLETRLVDITAGGFAEEIFNLRASASGARR